MLDAVAVQLENNRRQQGQIRKDFYRYSDLAAQAKIRLMGLAEEQINLKIWGMRNAIPEAENVDCKTIDGCKGTKYENA